MLSGWHMSTRIHLLYEEIHHSRQIANKKKKKKKKEILDRKQLTHKMTIGLKVATGHVYK